MAKTYIQLIKAAAARVRDSKLEKLGTKETAQALEALQTALNLENRGEALIFAALFDRSCTGRDSDMGDLARYFNCTHLDIMEYLPAIGALQQRGLIVQSNADEARRIKKSYLVTGYVTDSLLADKMPDSRPAQFLHKAFDRYDFCKLIAAQMEDDDTSCEELLQMAGSLEKEHADLQFVAAVQKEVEELRHRVLFYDICHDFTANDRGRCSSVDSTLKDMYSVFSIRLQEKSDLLAGTHPLQKADLLKVDSDGESMGLTEKGQRLFLEQDYAAFYGRLENLDRYKFASAVNNYIHSRNYDADSPRAAALLTKFIRHLEATNSHLKFIGNIKSVLESEQDRALFYILCRDCSRECEGTPIPQELRDLFDLKTRKACMGLLKEETHILQRTGLAEVTTHTSLFGEATLLSLTDKGKRLFFEEDAELFIEKESDNTRIKPADITPKRLFFSEGQQKQLSLVENALREENFCTLQSRLESKGMPKGVAVLLYGAPGTGKTETVMQWARSCGRDIIHVDISSSKSMWFGESEKIIKKIFSDYRSACSGNGPKPILLFNEADAIFSCRRQLGSRDRSIHQTENAMQNIILEEMERLDGILIATTNLEGNLDGAFERRFLFKIRYEKPSLEAKMHIWRDKIGSLSEQDALRLASQFDFSGGEIDNIVRKATMEEVVSGAAPTLEMIESLCSHEKLPGGVRTRIGF